MDEQTLKKLQNNPHYKMSDKQRADLYNARNPMHDFKGNIVVHDNEPETVKPKVIRKKRNG